MSDKASDYNKAAVMQHTWIFYLYFGMQRGLIKMKWGKGFIHMCENGLSPLHKVFLS